MFYFIEIPLFHVLNARITFGNIFGMDQEVPHVGHLLETNRITCLIDDTCFEAPMGYVKLGKHNIIVILYKVFQNIVIYIFYRCRSSNAI